MMPICQPAGVIGTIRERRPRMFAACAADRLPEHRTSRAITAVRNAGAPGTSPAVIMRRVLARGFLLMLSVLPSVAAQAQAPVGLVAVRDLHVAPEFANLSLAINMAVSQGGVIAVTQPLDNTIRFFSATGKPVGSVGRPGAGPGEFRYVGYLLWTADTLWVADMVLRRVTLISSSRQVLRTVPLPSSATYQPGDGKASLTFSSLSPWARYPGGTMLFSSLQWDRDRGDWLLPGYLRGEVPLLRVAPDGIVAQVIGFRPSSRHCDEGEVTIPFCAEPYEAFAADGSRFAFATVQGADRVAGKYRVVAIGSRGDTIINRTYPFSAVPIARSSLDSARARTIKGAPTAAARADAERMRIPTVYPPLRNLVVGRDGTVWVELRARSTERRWQVLAPDGRPIGEVSFPSNVSLKVAQRDRIWALIENEDGEQGIASYAIRGGK